MPALTGGPFHRGPIFWHYPHYSNQGGTPCCGLRDGRWKLIHFFEDDRDVLYDLSVDLGEHHDLAAERPDEVSRLRSTLDAWLVQVDGRIPAPNAHDEPFADLAGYYLGGKIAPPPEPAR
jgi:hypothetical protein